MKAPAQWRRAGGAEAVQFQGGGLVSLTATEFPVFEAGVPLLLGKRPIRTAVKCAGGHEGSGVRAGLEAPIRACLAVIKPRLGA